MAKRRLRCSFCGKSEADVAKLVAGPRVFICDECVALADRIMKGDIDRDGSCAAPAPSTWSSMVARIRNVLGGGTQRMITGVVTR